MQCYESELMRLQLRSYLREAAPGLRTDPLFLDGVLADAGLVSYRALVSLASAQRDDLVRRALAHSGDGSSLGPQNVA